MKNNNPIIVAMTGASGAVLGYQTIQSLIDQKVNVIFVCSSAARMVWKDENLPPFGETVEKWENTSLFKMYSNNDFYSPIASGTFKTNLIHLSLKFQHKEMCQTPALIGHNLH